MIGLGWMVLLLVVAVLLTALAPVVDVNAKRSPKVATGTAAADPPGVGMVAPGWSKQALAMYYLAAGVAMVAGVLTIIRLSD